MGNHNRSIHNRKKKERNRQRSRPSSSSLTPRTKSKVCGCVSRRFPRPFEIGYYSPGTAPDHIPYHLYLLLKEAFSSSSLRDLERVEKKISFFCDFFYTHLPLGWKYERDNAASLIAGCDTFFAKGGPKYNLSGYTPLGDSAKDIFDIPTLLSTKSVFQIMSLIHSRKTPSPEIFWSWGTQNFMSFYCKLCSCFGIDYHHLEAASEDDVILMDMGPRIAENNRFAEPASHDIWHLDDSDSEFFERLYRNKPSDDEMEHSNIDHETEFVSGKIMGLGLSDQQSTEGSASHNQICMRKLNSSDEAFELSKGQMFKILRIVVKRSPPLTKWNAYQTSFYLKMCSCFGVDYQQHLQAA